MYADAFNQIDEKRLIFIASHIVQVLDNNLLYQSMQRELELDFETLNVIGLEQYGLELLDILRAHSSRIMDCLGYLTRREAYRSFSSDKNNHEMADLRLEPYLVTPKKFIQEIDTHSHEPDQKEYEITLGSIMYPSQNRVGKSVIDEILKTYDQRAAEMRWLRIDPSALCAENGDRVAFMPNETFQIKDEEPYARIMIREMLKNQCGTLNEGIELTWSVRKKPQTNDLRVLWGADKVLEDVLKIVEATAGGNPHGISTLR